jgi:hypothetical protein
MTVDLIDNLIKQLKPSIDNFQTFLRSLATVDLINDFLVVEKQDVYECYYQMDETERSFYYTTVVKA